MAFFKSIFSLFIPKYEFSIMVVANALELPFQQYSVFINLNLVEMYLIYLITNYCFSEIFSTTVFYYK